MPNGRDINIGRRTGTTTGGSGGGGTTKKNAFCSFCRKSYRDVGPLVEGPGDVYICGECIELCQSILDQERRRRGATKQLFTRAVKPRKSACIVFSEQWERAAKSQLPQFDEADASFSVFGRIARNRAIREFVVIHSVVAA